MFNAANVTVMVDDLDRSASFYVDTLGLSPGAREAGVYVEVLAPGVTIGLHPRRAAAPAAGSGNLSTGFAVDGLHDVVARLQRRGIEFDRQQNDANRFAFFRDPDGTPLYLFEPR
jgi:catechol 2,3-dioxygenase-like lactoylglutathione lyase family enzyme